MKKGDRVKASSKYFNEFNDMTGTVLDVVDKLFHIEVKLDDEFDVKSEKIFHVNELKKCK